MVVDTSISKLRVAQETFQGQLVTELIQEFVLTKLLKKADLVIGALSPVDGRTPMVVTEDIVEGMPEASIIIDISIDSGGCFETSEITSHDNPCFEKHGIIHYCIPNMASAVGRTASIAMSNFVGPMVQQISEHGGVQECLHYDLNVRSGLYLYRGLLTKRHLGEHFDLPFSNDSLLFGSL